MQESNTPSRSSTVVPALCAALLCCASVGHAQERVTIRGHVLDAVTRDPLQGVVVTALLPDLRVITDSLGTFEFSLFADRGYDMVAEDMGYHAVRFTLGAEAPDVRPMVLLEPNAEMLQGLATFHERLAQRRRTRGSRLELIEHDELLTSEAPSGYLVLQRAVPMARRCTRETENLCVPGGARERRVRICVDDVRPAAGASELDAYEPSDLWLVEIYGFGSQVRVYTRWFVDEMARSRQGLVSLNPPC